MRPAPPIRRRGGLLSGFVLLTVATLGLSGCEVTATVGVDVSGRGGEVAKFDLTLSMDEGENGLHARFNYNTGLFDAATIASMAQRFALLLETLAAEPGRLLKEIDMLSAAERRHLLENVGRGPAQPYPSASSKSSP